MWRIWSPLLTSYVQGFVSAVQAKFGMNAQANSLRLSGLLTMVRGNDYTPSDQLTDTPPTCHQRQEPLALGRQIFQEYCRVHDEVSPRSECRQGYKQSQNDPIRRGTCHNRENRTDEQGGVERYSSAYDICRKAPKESTCQHSAVYGNSQTRSESALVGIGSRLRCAHA